MRKRAEDDNPESIEYYLWSIKKDVFVIKAILEVTFILSIIGALVFMFAGYH